MSRSTSTLPDHFPRKFWNRAGTSAALLKNMDSFRFATPPQGYLESRSLRRHARVPHLWALGVGAVISGDFFGWNFGFLAGGFGGLLVALGLVTLLYIGLCFSLAEMSPALPHAGGAYSFARTSMGPLA